MQDSDAAERREAARTHARAVAEPILVELRDAGLALESIDDLLRPDLPYREQLPIIISWISRCSDLAVREVLVRSLAVPEASRTEASRILIQEFLAAPNDLYRWAVGLALTGAARPADAESIIKLFRSKEFGIGRQELARVIVRLRPPAALETLVEALDDDEVTGHAVEALGFLGDPRAIPALERMRAHSKPWIRKAATRAVRKIEKLQGAAPEAGGKS